MWGGGGYLSSLSYSISVSVLYMHIVFMYMCTFILKEVVISGYDGSEVFELIDR